MMTRSLLAILCLPWLFGFAPAASTSRAYASDGAAWPVQMPYEAPPPKAQPVPDATVPQNTQPLSPEELRRAEALLPLLEGKQEFWAMGEFVHLGEPVVPVVTKALTMSGPRIRYNAIETLSMLKSPAAAPALVETAKQTHELPRIREHALRVAIRLDPASAPGAIEVMAKDGNSVIRKSAAFEARYVRSKDVIQPLIDLIADDEKYVAISALQSLWMLTRHETEFHDWENSSKQDRQAWVQEWMDWWAGAKDSFEIPEIKRRRSS